MFEPVKAMALPFLVIALSLVALELLVSTKNKLNLYQGKDSVCNFVILLVGKLSQPLFLGYYFSSLKLLEQFRLFDIPATTETTILAVVLTDLVYYWEHRTSHKLLFLWLFHEVHHSSRTFNLSTSFRLSWLGRLTAPIIFAPLILLGFKADQVIIFFALNLFYQFFLHTQTVKKLGLLEGILNTPSAHRVHHARNELYIDKNFGGILMIWDRLFGTYKGETEIPQFGILGEFESNNPLVVQFHNLPGYEALFAAFKSLRRSKSLQEKITVQETKSLQESKSLTAILLLFALSYLSVQAVSAESTASATSMRSVASATSTPSAASATSTPSAASATSIPSAASATSTPSAPSATSMPSAPSVASAQAATPEAQTCQASTTAQPSRKTTLEGHAEVFDKPEDSGLTGLWKASIKEFSRHPQISIDQQDDDQIRGTYKGLLGKFPLRGTFNKESGTVQLYVDFSGARLLRHTAFRGSVAVLNGTLNGNTIVGTATIAELGDKIVHFEARKSEPKEGLSDRNF